MAEVNVNLGARSYRIEIETGCIRRLGTLLQQLAAGPNVLLISDDNVFNLYGNQVVAILESAGFCVEVGCVQPGEVSKSLDVAETLYTKAISMNLDRTCAVVALGGGVVGDLAGFVAATYLRGIKFIQIPTSLLAQVDSSVGGKVAVNHALGKNMIGVFYQPHAVLIDPSLLSTLPAREFASGMAEVIKYGVICDADFFDYLMDFSKEIIKCQPDKIEYMIQRCCAIKADIVSKDERESSLRMILNFGHTIAHGVEKASKHQYNHGEAVAIGMYGAALLSAARGNCSLQEVKKVALIVAAYHLPLQAPNLDIQTLISFIRHDKKTLHGKINWILLKKIGQVFIDHEVSDFDVEKVLNELI